MFSSCIELSYFMYLNLWVGGGVEGVTTKKKKEKRKEKTKGQHENQNLGLFGPLYFNLTYTCRFLLFFFFSYFGLLIQICSDETFSFYTTFYQVPCEQLHLSIFLPLYFDFTIKVVSEAINP